MQLPNHEAAHHHRRPLPLLNRTLTTQRFDHYEAVARAVGSCVRTHTAMVYASLNLCTASRLQRSVQEASSAGGRVKIINTSTVTHPHQHH